MGINEELAKVSIRERRKDTLWKGPEVDGITFSLLSKFLVCRERFRCLVVDGLKPKEEFVAFIEVGNMWHLCEEWHAKYGHSREGHNWHSGLGEYVSKLSKRYRLQMAEIEKWYNVVKLMFPIYVEYWKSHSDVVERTPLLQEQVFDVPYRLPSGRSVRLRGKWDSVDIVGHGKNAGVYIQENKTKSEIDEEGIRRQLTFDLQTMMYLVALQEWKEGAWRSTSALHDIRGVRYNVIKRPAHRQGAKETPTDFYTRLTGVVQSEPHKFFARWKVEIRPGDIEAFRKKCLDPLLEELCEWWTWVSECQKYGGDPFGSSTGIHHITPFGVYNSLLEGGGTSYDNYIMTGGEMGLQQATTLFKELE